MEAYEHTRKVKKEKSMPFIELRRGNRTVHYWQANNRFFRQYSFESKAKRVSWKEYMSVYEEFYDL